VKIVTKSINIGELRQMAPRMFGNLVKAVVDVEKRIMAVDAEMHADEEQALMENGSVQKDLWGINIYPDIKNDNWIEFDSMINLRPSQNNRSRGIESEEIRKKIIDIVDKLIIK
jgi:hypothetical protein